MVWVLELNPYSKQFQVYTQTCDNMILENTHCKGAWHDNPVQNYAIQQSTNQVIANSNNQLEPVIYETCQIKDSKNWACANETTQQSISVEDCLLYTSPSPRDATLSRMPSSA